MARFSGNNATVTFEITNGESSLIWDTPVVQQNNKSLNMQWINKKSQNLKNGLLFLIESKEDLFSENPQNRIECRLQDFEYNLPQYDNYELMLLITGFELPDRVSSLWKTQFDPLLATRGKIEDGNARHVYEFVGDKHSMNFYAGLTVHDTYGTSSNYPMHEFENIACGAPLEVYPNFSEKFGFVTKPEYMWGIQVQSPAWSRSRNILPFKDRDIIDIPMGPHFSMAGPATRLAYFWTYTGAGKKDY